MTNPLVIDTCRLLLNVLDVRVLLYTLKVPYIVLPAQTHSCVRPSGTLFVINLNVSLAIQTWSQTKRHMYNQETGFTSSVYPSNGKQLKQLMKKTENHIRYALTSKINLCIISIF